ncbi:hypothetical protein [Bradyrhizobium sp. JYMT SZCCT0428]|uniref:hypothetical protein n=1 Tax=Bradyrhizobium sp. JYMT SZCCT0428 TaxID=2807673 RepID=UPI001BA4B4BA|nr:hypothetical protein [Bradyrhizobium sp. JYMT SZCCT0428]MBR1154795.1 hypothetical protein [Bradyrhizobium sp. JYMT SZCCT0428]
MTKLNTEARELNAVELDSVSGGFIWIPVVVVAFATGTAIRMGIDAVVDKVTK